MSAAVLAARSQGDQMIEREYEYRVVEQDGTRWGDFGPHLVEAERQRDGLNASHLFQSSKPYRVQRRPLVLPPPWEDFGSAA